MDITREMRSWEPAILPGNREGVYDAVGYGIYLFIVIDAQSTVTMLYCRSSQLPEQRLAAARRPSSG